MISLSKILHAHFDSIRKDLDRTLSHVQEGDLRWTPKVGMPPIADLLLEIANKETETIGWIKAGEWPDDAEDNFDAETAPLAEIKTTLASNRLETFRFIDSMTDEELQRLVKNPNRWNEGYHLLECPLSEVLRFIATHEWYHTGQLVSYLWLKGEDPTQW